ncbi:predicted protein [Uncinocarpus reesii 1704]|uniref:Uncharacterized protein n=1 Tax=Uncinocarpus reesii (strain UAMH 1704) TaxID=336963 RepID=C4JFI4_UNCRE|nr:uncharacterized protein UREG_00998 [Uncinocarpus reesii 1704]EEP76149.1 predicted protein [Uncinocarpus reesii 1704]
MAGIGSIFGGFKFLSKPTAKSGKRARNDGGLSEDLSAFERALDDARPALLERGKLRTVNECSKFIDDTKELLNNNRNLQEKRSSALISRLHGYILLLNIAVNSPAPGTQDAIHELDAMPVFEPFGIPASELDARVVHELEGHVLQMSIGTDGGDLETSEAPLSDNSSVSHIAESTDFQVDQMETAPPYRRTTRTDIASYQRPFSCSTSRSFTSLTTLSSSHFYPSRTESTQFTSSRADSEFAKALKDNRISIATILKCVKDSRKRSQLSQESINKALIFVSKHRRHKDSQIQIEAINVLLKQCVADIEYRDEGYGRTPLIWAVHTEREDIVNILLDNNASIEGMDTVKQCSPLIWAVCLGHEVIIRLLIGRGASLRAADPAFERTPLLWATKKGAFKIAKLLLEFIQDPYVVDLRDKDGKTALALAYTENHQITANALLEAGADPNFTFKSGRPLLISAIMGKDWRFVHLLVNKGANKNIADPEGLTARDWARRTRDRKIISLVCSGG